MGVRPKKSLGQHFLTDKSLAQRIVDAITPQANELIIEIGPGKGILTTPLIERFGQITAIELDFEAVDYLQRTFGQSGLCLIHQDILAYTFPEVPLVLIGNLPYNISSPLFFKVLDHKRLIREAVFMVQHEVAQRIAAPPGSKLYGILSVLLGYDYEVRYCFKVGAGAFFPPPKVQSAVIKLTRRQNLPALNDNHFRWVVKAAFNQRRKTLSNALKGVPVTIPDALKSERAEQLTIAQFAAISRTWVHE